MKRSPRQRTHTHTEATNVMVTTGRKLPDSFYKSLARNDKKRDKKKVWMCPECGELIKPVDVGVNNPKLRKLLRETKPLR